jgi:hypothetical protein
MALCIDPRRHEPFFARVRPQPCERLERGDRHNLAAGGKSQALDGCDANPQPRERARSGGDGEDVHAAE